MAPDNAPILQPTFTFVVLDRSTSALYKIKLHFVFLNMQSLDGGVLEEFWKCDSLKYWGHNCPFPFIIMQNLFYLQSLIPSVPVHVCACVCALMPSVTVIKLEHGWLDDGWKNPPTLPTQSCWSFFQWNRWSLTEILLPFMPFEEFSVSL